MKTSKSTVIVLLLTVLLLTVVQMIRMNVLLGEESFNNVGADAFSLDRTVSLPEKDRNPAALKKVLILHGKEDMAVLRNVVSVLDIMQIQYVLAPNIVPRSDYEDMDMVLVLENPAADIVDMEQIRQYVRNGGRLVYLGNGNLGDEDLLVTSAALFGVKSSTSLRSTSKIMFNTEILSGMLGSYDLDSEYFLENEYIESLDVNLQDDCRIHMADATGNPMIWERKEQHGRVMVLNIGRYESKLVRGLIAGSLSIFDDLMIYPVIGSAVVFIDDFPADYRSAPEILQANYGRNFQRFVLEIWWPDMAALMKKYDYRFTTAYIKSYNDQVREPFEFDKAIEGTMQRLASDIIKNQGEVCFHGYNHQPLFFTQSPMNLYGYKAWPDSAMIGAAIRQSITFFQDRFSGYQFHTYVPPSNMLEPEAIPALTQAIPTLRTISGTYFESTNEAGEISSENFTQEFTVDSRYGIALPRVTAGSFYSDAVQYIMASVVTTNGIVNHFIHPDDILDPDRSYGLLWEQLRQENEKLLGGIDRKYEWLSKDTADQAAQKLQKAYYARLYYTRGEHSIQIACDNFSSGLTLMVTSKDRLTAGNGCTVRKIDSIRYLVTMTRNMATLEVTPT